MLPAAAPLGRMSPMTPGYGGPTLPDERIVGDGIVLRPLAEDDIDPVADACNDPETLRWLPLPRPYGRPEARWFIDIFAPTTRDSGAGIIRAIEREGRLVGCIDVKRVDWAARTAEVGYWMAPWGRGCGVATSATRAISELGAAGAGVRAGRAARRDGQRGLAAGRREGRLRPRGRRAQRRARP